MASAKAGWRSQREAMRRKAGDTFQLIMTIITQLNDFLNRGRRHDHHGRIARARRTPITRARNPWPRDAGLCVPPA
jgi:hypothetical protein